MLRLTGISKRFGAIEALDGIDLALDRGEVLGLMGDNGAGKSTLVKIIGGSIQPSAGEIRAGRRADPVRPAGGGTAEGD